jgi:3'(2'), 5'-bisphosphate nucleotidase
MKFNHELQVAMKAVELASERIRHDYVTFVAIPNAPASISTDTDRASQDLILKHLHAAFPDDAFCAEEATESIRSAKKTGSRVWIVDPIDGTRGFAMKNGEFSVMVGFMVENEIEVGIVAEPALDRVTYATRGGGCWCTFGKFSPTRCAVRSTNTLSESILVRSHAKPGRPDPVSVALKPIQSVETYSGGVKLAMVARGEVDLYVNDYSNFADWDICAGHILVTEAGGKVTRLNGDAITYLRPDHSQLGGLLATNGRIHEEAIRLLKAAAIS